MKINIAFPRNGTQKSLKLDDEKDWAKLIDKHLGQEFDGALLGPQYKGYTFRITGGSDTDGFPMKMGVMTKSKVRLFLKPGTSGFFARREGTGKRKTIRGSIISSELASINLVLINKGEKEIEGLTDKTLPRRLGPKRANKIRKLFNLPRHSQNIGVEKPKKIDVDANDVCRTVVKRPTKEIGEKKYYKAPKIQRLITADRLRRKRERHADKYAKVKLNQEKLKAFIKREHNKHAKPVPAKDAKAAPAKDTKPVAAPAKVAAPVKAVAPAKPAKGK